MALISMRQLLDHAAEFGYGVPAFNVNNLEHICEGIKHGVRKINIDTDLRLASTGAIRRFMANNPSEFDPRKYLKETMTAMKDIVIARYEAFGTAGYASKINALSLELMFKQYESGETCTQNKQINFFNIKAY